MEKVLVCVTPTKSCDRLIRYGREIASYGNTHMMVVHITPLDFADIPHEEAEMLDYLNQSAMEHDAYLAVIRSNNVAAMIASLIGHHDIKKVIMGESRKEDAEKGTVKRIRAIMHDAADLIVVPFEEGEDD